MKLPTLSFAALAAVPLRSTGSGAAAATQPSKKDEMAARKLEEAKQAVQTLATIKTKDDQKARAAQKVQELKARLQALKMIYAGDPKKLARAAAQIARELAAAVKSYTSAGGSTAELAGADAGDASAGAAAPAGEAKAEAPAAGAGEATPPAETAEKDKAAAEGEAAKPEATALGTNKAAAEKRAADAARAKADDDFKNEARALARELKAALRRKDPKHGDEDDRRSGEQALAEVDKAVGALPIADVGAVSAVAGI